MVISITRSLLSSTRLLTQLALLLLLPAEEMWAASANLAPGLELDLPEPLVAHVIEAEEVVSGPVLVGEIEGQSGYFMAAVRVQRWERNNILWQKLESEIATRSDAGSFHSGEQGSFITKAGDNVWYRLYEYQSDDQTHRQAYYLLKGERTAYWITVTMVDQVSPDLALPIAQALIRRAQLAE